MVPTLNRAGVGDGLHVVEAASDAVGADGHALLDDGVLGQVHALHLAELDGRYVGPLGEDVADALPVRHHLHQLGEGCGVAPFQLEAEVVLRQDAALVELGGEAEDVAYLDAAEPEVLHD